MTTAPLVLVAAVLALLVLVLGPAVADLLATGGRGSTVTATDRALIVALSLAAAVAGWLAGWHVVAPVLLGGAR